MNTAVPDAVPDTALLTRENTAQLLDQHGSLAVTTRTRRHADGELHTHYCPRYRLVDTDVDGLRLLQVQFGGTIFHHSGRHYSWEIGQAILAGVLEEILPLMREKRRQAELILQLVDVKENGNDQAPEQRIVEELRRLNAHN